MARIAPSSRPTTRKPENPARKNEMTPKSFMTIVTISPWGERSERAVDLLPAATFGAAIASAVFRGTHAQDLDALKRTFAPLREDTPIPLWDGSWEDRTGKVSTIGEAFPAGKLMYMDDPSGRTYGAHGTMFLG